MPIGKGSHPDPIGVIGEIVLMHLRDDIKATARIERGRNHRPPRCRIGAHPSAEGYCYTLDAFEMVRPVYQPASKD
jgi:hypothetical protein